MPRGYATLTATPAAIGRQLQIRGVSFEIIGIAPEDFVGLDLLPATSGRR
jgi:hypothetical protein